MNERTNTSNMNHADDALRQTMQRRKARRENITLPEDFEYKVMSKMMNEAMEKQKAAVKHLWIVRAASVAAAVVGVVVMLQWSMKENVQPTDIVPGEVTEHQPVAISPAPAVEEEREQDVVMPIHAASEHKETAQAVVASVQETTREEASQQAEELWVVTSIPMEGSCSAYATDTMDDIVKRMQGFILQHESKENLIVM